jgi:hypothetical protein
LGPKRKTENSAERGNPFPHFALFSHIEGKRKTMTAPNDPSNVPATNPAPVDVPPVQPAQQQPPSQNSPRPPVVVQNDNSNVLNAVNSLPEKIVDAVRELIPQSAPASPATPSQPQQPATPQTTPQTDATGNRRSVGEWFFGVKRGS